VSFGEMIGCDNVDVSATVTCVCVCASFNTVSWSI